MDIGKTYLSDQRHKQHKKLNVKLEKKRQGEKERKIKKKEKKQERSNNTVKYHKAFKDNIKGVNFHRLKRQVDLFKEKFPNELDDLAQILEFIDQGKKIDVRDVENGESKILIENIFEILGVEGKDQVYTKNRLDFSCKDAVMMTAKNGACAENHNSDEEDRDNNAKDDGSIASASEDRGKAAMTEAKPGVPTRAKAVQAPVLKHPVVEKIPAAKSFIEKDRRFADAIAKQPHDMLTAFGTQSTYQNYDRKLGGNRNADAGLDENHEEKSQRMQLYFDNYDKINRPKTLLETHNEKLAAKGKPSNSEPTPKDAPASLTQKSQKLFSILNNDRFSIQKDFSEARFKNSFM